MASLGQLRYSNAVQALADQLSYYQHGPDAEAALEGLAGIGHPTSVDIFRRLLATGDPKFRRLAVEGLARAGTSADLPDLQRAAQSEKLNPVLLAFHYAALKLGAPASKPDALVASLRDSALRPLVLQYLLDLSPSIAPALADHLQDPDPETRMLLADVLGFSRDTGVVPRLEAAAKDPDRETAQAAVRAIDRIKLR
jgi:HEAT repeat protein